MVGLLLFTTPLVISTDYDLVYTAEVGLRPLKYTRLYLVPAGSHQGIWSQPWSAGHSSNGSSETECSGGGQSG